MAGTVCSKCNVGWELYSHERYCGYCGCQIFDFSVRWQEELLLYAGDGPDTRELTMLIENRGACPLRFQPIQTKQNNAIQVPQTYQKPFEVKAGQLHPIVIQVNPANLTSLRERITVHPQEELPNFEREESFVSLRVLPRPDFKLTPNPVDVRYQKNMETKIVYVSVEALQSEFDIRTIKFSRGWLRRVSFSRERHGKDLARKNIQLEIDCDKLKNGLNSETLHFELRGFDRPIEKQVQVQAEVEPAPPRLFVPKMILEVTQGREKTSTLTLQNRGERPLSVQNIVFNGKPDFIQLLDVDFPIEIEGGEHQNVQVIVSADGIEPGTERVNFTITSNCEAEPQYQEVLDVTVKQREAYPYYLAVDFGTTNSCCAYIDDSDNYQLKLIELDINASPSDIIPSSIVYHSQPTNRKLHHVGYDAETYRTSEVDGPYYITSIKTWLGYEWARPFPNKKLQPCDIVADILKHIIEQAEEHLDAVSTEPKSQSKITKCVVTYPTVFSRRQQDDLRLAFKKIGITELLLIDEASAASIGTVGRIFQRDAGTPRDAYRLLVYDFGGGTIDIVLSKVMKKENDIEIEPLAYGGNPRYGGDDVTQAIVEFILDEFEKRISGAHPELRFDIPYLKLRKIGKPLGNPKIDKAARDNANRLYLEAEKMKQELSEKSETTGTFSGLVAVVGNNLSVVETLTGGQIDIKLSEQQLQSLIEPELKKTFAEIDAMIKDNGKHPPDTVILAGQSSKMRLVKETMRAHFKERYRKDINIHLNERPKACVVLGAAQYSFHNPRSAALPMPPDAAQIEVVKMVNKTHSRFGIAVAAFGKPPAFSEIIPKGRWIPHDSCNTIGYQLPPQETSIDVYEHFGMDDELSKAKASRVAKYTLKLPATVPEKALREARLKMAVKGNGEIELTALVDGKEYKSTVHPEKPPFVDENLRI